MLNTLNKQISIFKRTGKKNFSVFAKLKDYLKSGVQSTVSIFGSNIDPEKIKVEIEQELAPKKLKKTSIKETKFTQEENKIIEQLPNQIIKYERNVTLLQQEEKERKVIDSLVAEIQKEDTSEMIKKTIKSKYRNIWEKLDNFETTSEGKIKLPLVYEEDGLTSKIFDNMAQYLEWKDKKVNELKEQVFNKLTPQEFYITQGKGTERPFTGDYWENQKVGVYCCKVCTQRIFSSTHKYQAKGIGHATFWNFLPFTLNFYEDNLEFPVPTQAIYKLKFASSKAKKRIACSNCDSHFGHVFDDGPAPFFKRLNINSAALNFLDIGWFESPDEMRRKKELLELMEEHKKIELELSHIQRLEQTYPKVFEYIDKNITDFEKELNYDKIAQQFTEKENSINSYTVNNQNISKAQENKNI